MKIVIDIPKEDYAETMYRKQHLPREMDWTDRVISDGTPLEKELNDIRVEIEKYGSIMVEYKITGNNQSDIEKIVGNVLTQAKRQVLAIIDKHIKE